MTSSSVEDESKIRRIDAPPWIPLMVAVLGSALSTLVFGFREQLAWLKPEYTVLPIQATVGAATVYFSADDQKNKVTHKAVSRYRTASFVYIFCIALWLTTGPWWKQFPTFSDFVRASWIPYIYCCAGWLVYTGMRATFMSDVVRPGYKMTSEETFRRSLLRIAVIVFGWIGALLPMYPSVDNDTFMLTWHFTWFTAIFVGHIHFTVWYIVDDVSMFFLFYATFWLLFVPWSFSVLYFFTVVYIVTIVWRIEQKKRYEDLPLTRTGAEKVTFASMKTAAAAPAPSPMSVQSLSNTYVASVPVQQQMPLSHAAAYQQAQLQNQSSFNAQTQMQAQLPVPMTMPSQGPVLMHSALAQRHVVQPKYAYPAMSYPGDASMQPMTLPHMAVQRQPQRVVNGNPGAAVAMHVPPAGMPIPMPLPIPPPPAMPSASAPLPGQTQLSSKKFDTLR